MKGRQGKREVVAARLREDLSVPPEAASELAETCLQSAEQAELISDGRFDPTAIEAHQHVVPEEVATSPETATKEKIAPKPPTEKKVAEKPTDARDRKKDQRQKDGGDGRPFVPPPVQVVVNVDVSHLSPKEIAELVQELQKPIEGDVPPTQSS